MSASRELKAISFVADVHLGNHKRLGGPVVVGTNVRCRQTLDVLHAAMQTTGTKIFVVLGDLFDTANPNPQLLTVTRDILKQATSVVLKGNHDSVSGHTGDHALGPLRTGHIAQTEARWVLPVAEPGLLKLSIGHTDRAPAAEAFAVPFQAGEASNWLPIVLEKMRQEDPTPRVLLLHLGIEDEHTAPFLRGAPDSIHIHQLFELCQEFHIARVFAGNWHEHQVWRHPEDDIEVHQVGALVPTGWDNPGWDYGYVAHLDPVTMNVTYTQLPGPRFVTVRGSSLNSVAVPNNLARQDCQMYVRWYVDGDLAAARSELNQRIQDGSIFAGEVAYDPKQAKREAHLAAVTARQAPTVEGALRGYIEVMPLGDTVDRAAVLRRAQAYLKEAP